MNYSLLVEASQKSIEDLFLTLFPMAREKGLLSFAESKGQILAYLRKNKVKIVIFPLRTARDLKFTGEIKKLRPESKVIVVADYRTLEPSFEAMKRGECGYIMCSFPLPYLKEIIFNLARYNVIYQTQTGHFISFHPKMVKIYEIVERIARSNSPLAIYGETGTGKELIAEIVHFKSRRAAYPLIKVNCAVLPDHLLENELFGHVRGAFTDARETKYGLLESANKGSFFMDEIGEISTNLQSKLLRVIEEGCFRRVGAPDLVKLDLRFITATNQQLKEKMEKGLFREDLFYRLSNISVSLPPLRERKTDIPYLIHYYLLYYSGQNHHPPKEISKETMEYLMEYPWPGNIRELKHVVEKALLLSHQHKILPEDIGFEKKPPTEIYKLKSLAEVEKEHIIKVLNLVRGNKRKAAEILKINESTLWRKMKRYKLKDKNTEKRNYVLPSASSSERKGT